VHRDKSRKYYKCTYYIADVLQKMINIKLTKYYFPSATKLTRRRHLDLVELLVVRLLFDHLLFTCGGGVIYHKSELTKDHSSTSCEE
jgi:hypothetical protein